MMLFCSLAVSCEEKPSAPFREPDPLVELKECETAIKDLCPPEQEPKASEVICKRLTNYKSELKGIGSEGAARYCRALVIDQPLQLTLAPEPIGPGTPEQCVAFAKKVCSLFGKSHALCQRWTQKATEPSQADLLFCAMGVKQE